MLKLTAYADKVSAQPGDLLNVMVNCDEPSYDAKLVRIVHGDTNPIGPGVRLHPVASSMDGTYPGRPQPINAGSFGIVDDVGRALEGLRELTVSAFIYPTTPDLGEQGIISAWDNKTESGFAVHIDETGRLAFKAGDGKGTIRRATVETPLVAKRWCHIAASIDSAGRLLLVQSPISASAPDVSDVAGQSIGDLGGRIGTIVIAGFHDRIERGQPVARHHFNGKIEMPQIARRAFDLPDLARFSAADPANLDTAGWIGAWDFSLDIKGTALTDVSGNNRHGRVVNMPTRGVVGHHLPLDEHDWRKNPQYWGAIHFHDDDIHDACWVVDLSWTIPADLRSGIYGVQLEAGGQTQFVVFVVRPASDAPRAKLLYLFPLATYMAYANEHFGTNSEVVELHLNRATVLHPHQVFLNEHREYGHSLYDLHSDGSGVYYTSRLRPMLNMQPMIESNHGARTSSIWQFNADTHITDWLEEQDIDYDVVTDEDLHREGIDILRPYQAVMTSSHPEYHSATMYDAIRQFTEDGGRLIYMGGNGFYWRVAFHETEDGIMEVRRAEGGSRAWEPPTGEYYHSFTGEYGGLWRRQGGRAPNAICGIGFMGQGFDESTYYTRQPDSFDPRASFIFEGIGEDERIGDFGLIGGGAAGMEVDATNVELGTPRHTLVLANSATLTEAHVLAVEEMLFNFMGTTGNLCPLMRSELVFFETSGGGAVFGVGSIAWSGALSHNGYNNNVSRIVRNVVRRFTDPTPFVVPST